MKYLLYFTLSIIFSILLKNSYAQYDFYNDVKKSSTYYFEEVRSLNEINAPSAMDAYPWISPDGLRLYYTKGVTYNTFYFASRPDTLSNFTSNVPLPMKFNNIHMYQIWLTDDELEAYYILYKPGKIPALYYSNRNSINEDFSDSTRVKLNGKKVNVILAPSLTKDKSQLFAYHFQKNGLETTYIFKKIDKYTYQLNDSLKTPKDMIVRPGQLSKDNNTYYLGLQAIDLLLPDGKGKQEIYYYTKNISTGKFNTIANKLDIRASAVTYYDYYQPSLSARDKYMVFVSNISGVETGNDMFFAVNPNPLIGIADNNEETFNLSNPFPNPSNYYFSITYKLKATASQQNCILEFYNIQGDKVKEINLNNSSSTLIFSVNDFSKGLYFYSIKTSKGNSVSRKLVIL